MIRAISALGKSFLRILIVTVLALLLSWPGSQAEAQDPSAPNSKLDAARATLDRVEASLSRPELSDSALQDLRTELEPAAADVAAVMADVAPRLEAAKARLAQLGSKPAAPAPAEAPDVSAERSGQEKLFNDLDAVDRRARVLSVLASQVSDTILARRRAIFSHALLARSNSLLSPRLWTTVGAEVPADLRALTTLARDLFGASVKTLSPGRAMALAAVLALVVTLSFVGWRLARRLRGRPPEATPSRLRRALAVGRVTVATAAVPIGTVLALGSIVDLFGLPRQLQPVGSAILLGVTLVGLVTGLTRGLLAPKSPNWRLPPLTDLTCRTFYHLAIAVSVIVALTHVAESLADFIAVALPTAVAIRGIGVLCVALAMLHTLRRARELSRRVGGPPTARYEHWVALWRLTSISLVVVLTGSVAVGYVAFGAFVVEQLLALALVAQVLYVLLVVADEGIVAVLKPSTVLGRGLMLVAGLRAETLTQIAILLDGAVRLVLYGAAALVLLAPWRVESSDMIATLRAAFFGFKVGDLTVSLSTALAAAVLFLGILGATRALQRWLEARLLPSTTLDAGLQNAIKTSLGYIGATLALGVALAHLGLSFERLAIVAGALSVGIGFGLQSVVNNFVSGLILLWERAIRVGDWIAVGDEQGYVRRINVRSTEIETFDRALVVMPNSSLITGVVKNWVRNDRIGRVRLPFTVPLTADPEEVRALLIGAAKAQEAVLAIPAPQVLFVALGDAALKFELVCFVEDVEASQRVTSDLLFDIHARFKAAGLAQAPAPPVMSNPALDKLDAWLRRRFVDADPGAG